MRFFTTASVLTLVASVSCQQWSEMHGGFRYILSGPRQPAPKAEYERKTCSFAIKLLSDRMHKPVPSYDNVEACKAELLAMKENLGSDGLLNLLQADIASADTFWHKVKDDSSATGWAPVDGRAVTFLPNVTAYGFASWSQSPFADKANLAANAEHYIKRTKALGSGKLESEILEGWGGVTTHFTIPNYGVPDRKTHPFLRALPQFPIQAAGDKVLMDGSNETFGVLHISVRDVDGKNYGEADKRGIEIFASVWYHDGVSEEHLEAERQHVIIEIVNLSLQAQHDIATGVFVPPINH